MDSALESSVWLIRVFESDLRLAIADFSTVGQRQSLWPILMFTTNAVILLVGKANWPDRPIE